MPTDDPQGQVLRCINQSEFNIEQGVELIDGRLNVGLVFFENWFRCDRFCAAP